MFIIKDPAKEIVAYAYRTRDAAHQNPSEKRTAPDGGPLYWIPLHAVTQDKGMDVEFVAFSPRPVPVRALDLVRLDAPVILDAFNRGKDMIFMYVFENVEVVGNLLDSAVSGFANKNGDDDE